VVVTEEKQQTTSTREEDHGADTMMNEELMERIISHAKEELYIENLEDFKKELEGECYLVPDGEFDKVVIGAGGTPCVCFDVLTGVYLGLEDLEYARQVGERL